ncbi:hypothetical protein OSTOST_08947, partial [Ostertagia ostertagi]
TPLLLANNLCWRSPKNTGEALVRSFSSFWLVLCGGVIPHDLASPSAIDLTRVCHIHSGSGDRLDKCFHRLLAKAEPELDSDTFVRLASTKNSRNIFRVIASSAQNMFSGRTIKVRCIAGTGAGRRLHISGLADWIEGPRDAANLPHIIQATKIAHIYCEREYAFGEMLLKVV